ncbi:MAG: ArsR family transcriptional regulator [Haloferacaceae archaeon]
MDRELEGAEVLADPGTGHAVNALRDRHRRLILRGLWNGRVARETDAVLRGDREEVRSELRETHLPMLEEAGIIEWDRETGKISKGPNFDEVEPLLELMEEHADELPPFWP